MQYAGRCNVCPTTTIDGTIDAREKETKLGRGSAALVADVYDGRLRMGPALRRREVCIAICAALIAVLAFATAVHLLLLASMRAEVASVFFRALALSGMLALLPLTLLWLLERRERQTPWLFAAAFLWGGCIATALALPFNSAFLTIVDTWVVQHPVVREVLGSSAAATRSSASADMPCPRVSSAPSSASRCRRGADGSASSRRSPASCWRLRRTWSITRCRSSQRSPPAGRANRRRYPIRSTWGFCRPSSTALCSSSRSSCRSSCSRRWRCGEAACVNAA